MLLYLIRKPKIKNDLLVAVPGYTNATELHLSNNNPNTISTTAASKVSKYHKLYNNHLRYLDDSSEYSDYPMSFA